MGPTCIFVLIFLKGFISCRIHSMFLYSCCFLILILIDHQQSITIFWGRLFLNFTASLDSPKWLLN